MLGTQMPRVHLNAVSSPLAFLTDLPRGLVTTLSPGEKAGNAAPQEELRVGGFPRPLCAVLLTRASESHPLPSPPTPQTHTAGHLGGVRNALCQSVRAGVPTCTHRSAHNSLPCLRHCLSHHPYPFLTVCVVT